MLHTRQVTEIKILLLLLSSHELPPVSTYLVNKSQTQSLNVKNLNHLRAGSNSDKRQLGAMAFPSTKLSFGVIKKVRFGLG